MNVAAATTLSPILVASAEATNEPLVVSLHDVAPATRTVCEKILSELSSHRVSVTSLLVVPNYHHGGPSTDDPAFIKWLLDLATDGHEIVIHGYFHERPAATTDGFATKLITQFYTLNEGEFYDLGYEESFRRITQARDDFRKAGLRPRGFVAPAWLLSNEGERAAADAEIEYTTRLTTVRDLRSNEDFAARSLVYSSRNGWRRTASLAWNATLYRSLRNAPLVRLSIHPVDYEYPEIWSQIVRFVDEMVETRRVTTYCDWIADRRVQTANKS